MYTLTKMKRVKMDLSMKIAIRLKRFGDADQIKINHEVRKIHKIDRY